MSDENLWGFLLFIGGTITGLLNILLRLKKLPNGMYDINSYMASIMSLEFWIIIIISSIIATIGIIISRECN